MIQASYSCKCGRDRHRVCERRAVASPRLRQSGFADGQCSNNASWHQSVQRCLTVAGGYTGSDYWMRRRHVHEQWRASLDH